MIILYHTHFHYRIITPYVALLGDCEIAVIVSLFIRLISCWKTPQNTGNNLSELQEIKHFLGGMPPPLEASTFDGRLGCLRILVTA